MVFRYNSERSDKKKLLYVRTTKCTLFFINNYRASYRDLLRIAYQLLVIIISI